MDRCSACDGSGVRGRAAGASGADAPLAGSAAHVGSAPSRCGRCVGRGAIGDGAHALPDKSAASYRGGLAPPQQPEQPEHQQFDAFDEQEALGWYAGSGAAAAPDDVDWTTLLSGGAAGAHVIAGTPQGADYAAANAGNEDKRFVTDREQKDRAARLFLRQSQNGPWYNALNPAQWVRELDAKSQLFFNAASKSGALDRFNKGASVAASIAAGDPAAGHNFNGRAVAQGARKRGNPYAGAQGALKNASSAVLGRGGDGEEAREDEEEGGPDVGGDVIDLTGAGDGDLSGGALADLVPDWLRYGPAKHIAKAAAGAALAAAPGLASHNGTATQALYGALSHGISGAGAAEEEEEVDGTTAAAAETYDGYDVDAEAALEEAPITEADLHGGAWWNSKGAKVAGALAGTLGAAALGYAATRAASSRAATVGRQSAGATLGEAAAAHRASNPRPKYENYGVLGVKPGSSGATVDKAFRTAVRAVHPDRGGTTAAAQRLQAAADNIRNPTGRIDLSGGDESMPPPPPRPLRRSHKRGAGKYADLTGGAAPGAPKHTPVQLAVAAAMPTHRVDVVPLGVDAAAKAAAGGTDQGSAPPPAPLPTQHRMGMAGSGGNGGGGHVAWRGEAPGHLFATLDPRTGHPVSIAAGPDGGPPRQAELDPDGGFDPLDGHAAAVARAGRVGGRGGRDDALMPRSLTDVQAMQGAGSSGNGGGGGEEDMGPPMAPGGYPAAWAPHAERYMSSSTTAAPGISGGRAWTGTPAGAAPDNAALRAPAPGLLGAPPQKRKRAPWHADHPMRKRIEVVKGVMSGRGLSLKDASRVVKEEGLWPPPAQTAMQ